MNDDLVNQLRLMGDRASYRPHMYHTAADRIEALTARAEAAEAREKECYEGWNACRSLALETIARAEAAEAERDALTAERDIEVADFAALKLAIAAKGGNEHAPTQDAYDAACRALGKHRARAEAAEAERDALTAENEMLREALIEERTETLWNAYNTGAEQDGRWMHMCMSDGEWLARECGLDVSQADYPADVVKGEIPLAAERFVAALKGQQP